MLLNPIFNYDSIYDCFTCMRADRYIGDDGYFAENREDFSRLDSCPRGTLAGIRPDSSHSFITLVGGDRLYAYGNDVDFSKMIVVGFHPVTVKDTGFFAELGVNTDSGFMMLVKAHPIEVFEETEEL